MSKTKSHMNTDDMPLCFVTSFPHGESFPWDKKKKKTTTTKKSDKKKKG